MVFKVAIISFLVTGYVIINLFFMSFVTSINAGHNLLGSFKFVVLMLVVYEFKNEWGKKIGVEREGILEEKFSYHDIITLLAVILGALVSFALSNELKLQTVAASSIVGLITAATIPKYQIPLYCGSFVGMASIEIFTEYRTVVIAGIITGLLLIGTKPIFQGFGGKLGVTAFFGTMITASIVGDLNRGPTVLSLAVNDWIILYFILGALFTLMLDEKKHIGVVASSSTIGLISSALLPVLHGEAGQLYVVAAFCGTFIGMSSLQRLHKRRYMIAAGVFGSIIFVYTSSIYPGLGGKLGSIAFGSTIATAGLIDINRNIFDIKNEKL